MNKKIFTLAAVITLLFFLINIIPLCAKAQNLQNAFETGDEGDLLFKVANGGGYDSETDETSVYVIIGAVIQGFLSIIGIIFLILMVFAGYKWMTAHGEEQKVTEAKDTIRTSIIGLIIVIGAYALSYFIIKSFGAGVLQNLGG